MDLDLVTEQIVVAAIELHKRLGPGLLENVYEKLLAKELNKRGLEVERQKICGFVFDGEYFPDTIRLDLLVNKTVIVELKSVEKIAPVHLKQLLSYLKLLNLPAGLLINFGGETLKEGLKRVLNAPQPLGGSSAVLRASV